MLERLFMQIARDKLDAELFADILSRAVKALRRQVEKAPVSSADEKVEKPAVAKRVEAHLNDLPAPKREPPHAAQRIEERLGMTVGPRELGALANTIKAGGPNVQIVRTEMRAIVQCVVHWQGKHFTAIYDRSRAELITAYPVRKKKAGKRMKIYGPRPQRDENLDEDDEIDDGELESVAPEAAVYENDGRML